MNTSTHATRAIEDSSLPGRATRRRLLIAALGASAAIYAGRAAAAAVCFDPDDLTAGQRSMRQSLNFNPASDKSQHCGGCAFFTAKDGDCGQCQIMGGPVPAQGHCDSWSPRK